MAEIVAQFRPADDLIEQLDAAEAEFVSGEFGEIILPLDRELATDAIYTDIVKSVRELSRELAIEGMVAWRNQALVQLNWPTRKVHIRFTARGRAPSAYDTPSLWVLGARFAAARAAQAAAVAAPKVPGLLARFRGIVGKITGGGVFGTLRRGFPALLGLGVGRLAVAGILVWTLLDASSLITVLSHGTKALAKGVSTVAKGVLGEYAPLIIGGAAVLVLGVVLLTRGR